MRATTGRLTTAPRPVHRNDTEGVIRSLARRLSSEREKVNGTGASSNSEEILFDAEIDGTRYLLIRMPKTDKVHLSPREQEIVRMVADGHPNKVIADVLNISSWTVGTHMRRIFAKLGVGSRAAMVARCGGSHSFE